MMRRKGFTLIELLTVAFIIAVMAAIMLPAIGSYRQGALKQRTENAIHSISHGLKSYRQDFGDYPPSEPDRVDYVTNPDIPLRSRYTCYYGGDSLLYYLNGRTAEGYYVTNPRGGKKVYPPRVSGVKVGRAPGASGDGFLDSWDNNIEYFKAYRNREAWGGDASRGRRTADIYPRAVNINLSGSGEYEYHFRVHNTVIGGRAINVGVVRWEPGWQQDGQDDYRPGWQDESVPVNATSYLLVSAGKDKLFGTADDVGNW